MSSYINTLLINEKEENKISKKEQEYQIHNEDSNRAYLCAIDNCGCRFSDPDELKEHLNSHKLL